MVGHKIEDESQAALSELLTRRGEPRGTPEVLVHHVAAHAIRRADIVRRRKVWQGAAEVLKEPLVSHGNLDSSRASLPDAHEPHRVKAMSDAMASHSSCGTVARFSVPLICPAQLREPHPGVDFVDDRMFGPVFHDISSRPNRDFSGSTKTPSAETGRIVSVEIFMERDRDNCVSQSRVLIW